MKKHISRIMAVILIISVLIMPAYAAGLNNFDKNNTYAVRFSDVAASHWAYESIYDCSAYGLMEGLPDGRFAPDESLTVAQAVVMADRVNEIYKTGRSTLENGEPWYEPYFEYAYESGISFDGEYADPSAPATRAQMAHIFYNALPQSAYAEINDVSLSDIPDVSEDTPYAAEIQCLYRAGILNGSDQAGTFYPDLKITRAAAAAIITRAVDMDARVSVSKRHLSPASALPQYAGRPYAVLNNNVPDLDASSPDALTAFEYYSDLDQLGRCGPAYANVCIDIMPDEARGEIGMIKPTGWHTVRYDDLISDKYLYNRCHLIAFMLAGENANEKNLITGTRYLNIEGMLPFENIVANYVKRTKNHVLYRVTPVFEGENLVASGVIMEALSVEDNGAGVMFCVYCFNEQPGVIIDHATGESERDPNYVKPVSDDIKEGDKESAEAAQTAVQENNTSGDADADYIINKNSGIFHLPSCPGVKTMAEKNKIFFHGTRDEAVSQGYKPCGTCKP
ncbi:MAG: DNA/RNA non-specific endonuclease [Clostridia bacterium]|nr:DNA/RNA non-specific endonuclease [Clostridia bacterium]